MAALGFWDTIHTSKVKKPKVVVPSVTQVLKHFTASRRPPVVFDDLIIDVAAAMLWAVPPGRRGFQYVRLQEDDEDIDF